MNCIRCNAEGKLLNDVGLCSNCNLIVESDPGAYAVIKHIGIERMMARCIAKGSKWTKCSVCPIDDCPEHIEVASEDCVDSIVNHFTEHYGKV